MEHEKKVEQSTKDMKIALLEDVMEDAKIDLGCKKEAAATAIQSSDKSVLVYPFVTHNCEF